MFPNDKEPGYCFIRHSETRDMTISSLVPGSYEGSHFLDLWLPGMMKAYSVIAKGIGELHGKRTQSAVLSSQWGEEATAICQIRLLCNTTKSPGEVTFRCVHSGVSNMWTGFAAWLAHHLRVKIELKLLHLLRDTKEFVDDLRHLHWQDGTRMVKIDIKEFYMSGKSGFLSHACSELFCDETEDFQQLVAKAVDGLCRIQFVQSEFWPDLTYTVTRGSGMGLLHSGEVSDAGFWIAAERWLLNTSVRQWCSLSYWRRFRDDIFAITSNFHRFNRLPTSTPKGNFSRRTRRGITDPNGDKVTFENILGLFDRGSTWSGSLENCGFMRTRCRRTRQTCPRTANQHQNSSQGNGTNSW